MRTRRFLAAIAASAFVLASAGPASGVPGDKDCKDFKSQRAAQKFFKGHNPKADPHQLDDDNDGKACETYDYD